MHFKLTTYNRKNDTSLVYKNTGNWKISKGYITLEDFFNDEDDTYSKEVTSFKDVLITCIYPIEKESGKFVIHHMALDDGKYFEKIK